MKFMVRVAFATSRLRAKTAQSLAPEPHVLLFRRPKDFDEQMKRQEMQNALNGKANAKMGRKK